MRRRTFLGGSAALFATPPFSPDALAEQPTKLPLIGYLGTASGPRQSTSAALRQGLREAGWVEGENVAFEYRWADNHYDRLPALAAELVSRRVDVIVTGNADGIRAAKAATSSIPIVFFGGGDLVAEGLIDSLARPGGNLTGFGIMGPELNPKRLDLLSQLVPEARVIALLVNPNGQAAARQIRTAQETARAKALNLQILEAGAAGDFETAFAALSQLQAGGLVTGADPIFDSHREELVALAARHAVPAIYEWREFAELGGLISYGPSQTALWRQVGAYVGRILAGEKPADLPVQQPTTFELVVNLKTAKALGLNVPPPIIARADEVIE
jgi:putative tryptophan/tyrosine transport system substrate-binding protein